MPIEQKEISLLSAVPPELLQVIKTFNIETRIPSVLKICRFTTSNRLKISLSKGGFEIHEYYRNIQTGINKTIQIIYMDSVEDVINYLLFYFYVSSFDETEDDPDDIYLIAYCFKKLSDNKCLDIRNKLKLKEMFEVCIPLVGKIYIKK